MTNSEIPSQAEKQNPDSDPSELDPEVLDKIKHPRSIHDQMKDLINQAMKGLDLRQTSRDTIF